MKNLSSLYVFLYFCISVFLTFFSEKSSAETVLKYCNNCESDYSFRAQAQGIANFDSSSVLIMNSTTGKIKKYSVEFMPPEPGSSWESGFYLSESSLSYTEKVTADKIFQAVGEIHDFFDANRNVPKDVLPSAYLMIGKTYNQSKLSRFYNETQTFGSAFSTYTSLSVAIAGKALNVNVVVVLNFSDGSSALLRIKGLDDKGQLEFELVEIRDKNGDLIGVNYKMMHSLKYNVYNFDVISLQKYLNAAALFGIKTVNLRSAPRGVTTIRDIECKAKQGKMVCEKVD